MGGGRGGGAEGQQARVKSYVERGTLACLIPGGLGIGMSGNSTLYELRVEQAVGQQGEASQMQRWVCW